MHCLLAAATLPIPCPGEGVWKREELLVEEEKERCVARALTGIPQEDSPKAISDEETRLGIKQVRE